MEDWFARRERIFFAALLIAHLVPIWWVQYVPTLDGPAHLSIADIMVRYDSPDTPAFREFYEFNPSLVPNYFIFAVLYALMQVFSPLVAEKILLSAYVLLLPLGLRYAIGAVAPEARVLSLLGFPLVYNYLLHLGFYNFVFGIAFFLFCFGFWFRNREKSSVLIVLGHLFFSLVLYFCHLFALVIACLAIAFTTLGEMVLSRTRPSRTETFDLRALWHRLRSRAVLPAAAFLPSLALAVAFIVERGAEAGGTGLTVTGGEVLWPIGETLPMLMTATALVAHDVSQVVVAKAYVIALLVIAGLVVARKVPGARRVDGLFFCLVGLTLVYFATPDGFFAHWTAERIMPYVFLAAVLWFASQTATAIPRRRLLLAPWVVVSVVAISSLGLSQRTAKYVEINDYIREYMAAAQYIEPNSTLLSLRVSQYFDGTPVSDRIDLFLQAAGYIAVERSVVDLKNVQAGSPYFPIRYRAAHNPFDGPSVDALFVVNPPRVDLYRYGERMGTRIDYVLVWGTLEELRGDPYGQRLMAQLGESYELIFTSPRRGLSRLYRLRPDAAGSPSERG